MNRGNKAVRSQPAEIELADMFVPICNQSTFGNKKAYEEYTCAIINDTAINQTPNRTAADGSPSRKRSRRSTGDHIVSLKITLEDDETMIPTRLTSACENGTANN
jgi:hypothetical protein